MSKKSRRVAKARRALFTLSLVLVMMVVAVGGTMAWLTDNTQEIKNTFAPTNIDIDLTETTNHSFDLVPGVEYAKDPIVKVVRPTTDVEIYLFVKFDEAAPEGKTTKDYLEYTSTLDTSYGWKQDSTLPSNVWYRTVGVDEVGSSYTTDADGNVVVSAADDCSWNLLVDNKVEVLDTLKKGDMPAENTVYLSYTAYAIQTAGFDTISDAWTQAQSQQ